MMTDGAIPLTVIGGYLGAGKTTLLNRLVRGGHGRKLAILVNDFGSINIDADLITGHDGETISLANGCVCCSIGGDLSAALAALTRRAAPPDHIVIEASGVADPAKIALHGTAFAQLRLDGIVAVADAETIVRRSHDKYVGDVVMCQLAAADLIVLSKTDLTGPQQTREVQNWLEAKVPGARVVEAACGSLPAELLLGVERLHDRGMMQEGGVQEGGAHENGAHQARFASWSFTGNTPLDRQILLTLLAALPATAYRAKGILQLAGDPRRKHVLQAAGARLVLEAAGSWEGAEPFSRMVLIGAGGDDELAGWVRRFEAETGMSRTART